MPTTFRILPLAAVLLLGVCGSRPAAAQESVTLTPERDNTLYEDAEGDVSNGAGDHLFTGMTGQGTVRRAVLLFDVAAAVPTGARVDSVRLELTMSKTNSTAGSRTVRLHRLERSWGEAASDADGEEGSGAAALPGDATWRHAFFDTTAWATPGGDFANAESASAVVGDSERYAWGPTDALRSDVESWIEQPETNAGWIVVGDESTVITAKRFDSREHPDASNRPTLTVYYTPTATSVEAETPAEPLRLEAFPNPFADHVAVVVSLAEPSSIRLDVVDVLGRRVAGVGERRLSAGRHEVLLDVRALAAGTYVLRLQAGGRVVTRTVVRTGGLP